MATSYPKDPAELYTLTLVNLPVDLKRHLAACHSEVKLQLDFRGHCVLSSRMRRRDSEDGRKRDLRKHHLPMAPLTSHPPFWTGK